MLLKFEILTFYILASFYLAKSNTISNVTSIFSSKSIKCVSLDDDDCKNDTMVKQGSDFQGECDSNATGCVKQVVRKYPLDNSTASTKSIKCTQCMSIIGQDCRNDIRVKQIPDFQAECKSGATDCLKHFVRHKDGQTDTYRTCYYGNISSFSTNFECEKVSGFKQLAEEKCYKCTGDFCNSSDRLKHSAYGIMLFTLTVMLISFKLKM